jgi:transposase-like protein
MPRKPKSSTTAAPLAPIPSEILDQFVRQGPLTPEELDAVVRRFKKAIIERALGGELTHHLGYALGGVKPEDTTNHRNGTSGKTVLTDDGPLPLEVPRDRDGTFEPRLIGKHERRFTGFDDKVIALYARGLTVREIQAFLREMYGVDVSPDLISTVTDGIVAEVTAWQARPLEPMYPVVFFDALRVKIRDEAVVRSKAVYLALAVLPDGARERARDLDRADGRCEVLDEGVHGPAGARLSGHPDRRDRWPQGYERGAGGRLSGDDPADLYRASAAQ